jgi:hypothetical protein
MPRHFDNYNSDQNHEQRVERVERDCRDCNGHGLDYLEKRCKPCLGHGRMCLDCWGHLEHDADPTDNHCDDCARHARADRAACAADFEYDCRRDEQAVAS